MNPEPSCAPSFSAVRRALLLAGGMVLLAPACTTTPVSGPDGGVFAPRYGYGSPQKNNPADPNRATTDRRTDGRKTPDIKRDPNDTTVDVTPPESKTDNSTPSGTEPATGDATSQTADTTTKETSVESTPADTKPAVPREDLPYGQPIVGKKGFVYSPYAPDKGQVDVDGIPAGTKVKCPYTQKVFRVP